MKARARHDVRYIHPYFRYREFNSPKLCRRFRSSVRSRPILPSVARVRAGMRSRIIPLNARRRSVNPAEKRTTRAGGSSRSFFVTVLGRARLPAALHPPDGLCRRTSGSRSFHPQRPNELDYAHRISPRCEAELLDRRIVSRRRSSLTNRCHVAQAWRK